MHKQSKSIQILSHDSKFVPHKPQYVSGNRMVRTLNYVIAMPFMSSSVTFGGIKWCTHDE